MSRLRSLVVGVLILGLLVGCAAPTGEVTPLPGETPPAVETPGAEASPPAAAETPTVAAEASPHTVVTAADTPAPGAATSGAGPSYNAGHGPYPSAPPALPWALKKKSLERRAFTAADIGDGTGQTDGSRQAPGALPNGLNPPPKF